MKKVLCLIDSLASGGAERQMSYLATGLKSRGVDVEVIVFSLGNDFFESYITSKGVPVIHDEKGINPYKRIFEIVRLVRQKRPDSVIAYKDGVTMAASLARIICNFKLIVSERNTTQELNPYERRKFALYRFADVIVPNSHSQAAFIREHYPKLYQRTKVITNTIDLSRFSSERAICKNDRVNVVILARLFPQKNVLTFLDALAFIRESNKANIHFKWYGSQEDRHYTEQVFRKVAELNLHDLINFYPATKEVDSVLGEADIFCLPSKYEGFPNVVCEAMAAGLPIVASRVSDIPYIVEEGINGFLFDYDNKSDMANKIMSLANSDSRLLKEMGARNREKIKSLCSNETFVDNYISLI